MSCFRGRLCLASRSPRRRELLQNSGFALEICPADVDERAAAAQMAGPRFDADQLAATLAVKKLEPLLDAHGWPRDCEKDERVPYLAADTIVVVDQEVLNKPDDLAEARGMLERLRDREHRVVTGFALAMAGKRMQQRSVSTKVWFRPVDDAEINAYLETDEPYDKAGAYGIQGRAAAFIDRVEGSYTNIVGLPVHEVIKTIQYMTHDA